MCSIVTTTIVSLGTFIDTYDHKDGSLFVNFLLTHLKQNCSQIFTFMRKALKK